MKIFNYIILLFLVISGAHVNAQTQHQTVQFEVAGNCAMCKKRIESASIEAGASKANWDPSSHLLSVTYDSTTTQVDQIKQNIAKVGHDTKAYRAETKVYESLHECCLYER